MLLVVFAVLLLILVYLPSLWVRRVMRRYAVEREDIPGTGAELAQHLIDRFELHAVSVEETQDQGDHYDPGAACVRLSSANYHGRSITAVAVAAHEVGHAIQFQREEPVSRLRKRIIPLAIMFKKVGIVLMYLVPVVAIVVKAPVAIMAAVIASFSLQLLGALAYLIVLPEEWDASFNKAMPILTDGDYVSDKDMQAVGEVLRAAAMTYFAAALADLVNLGRWLIILRR